LLLLQHFVFEKLDGNFSDLELGQFKVIQGQCS